MMPKQGFDSVTLPQNVFDPLKNAYENRKDELAKLGIRSVSGYVSHLIRDSLERDAAFSKIIPRFEVIMTDSKRILLKDTRFDEITEVSAKSHGLNCDKCDSMDCQHVGFSYSLPAAYKLLDGKRYSK